MKVDQANQNVLEAQSDLLIALHRSSEIHSGRLNDLSSAIDALAKIVEAQRELVDAKRADYDEKLTLIVARIQVL